MWRWAKGYKGRYTVSSRGNVLSFVSRGKEGEPCLRKKVVDWQGYSRVGLLKDKKYVLWKVSRLVAIAFLENDANLKVVNHIDGFKSNDYVGNLEWCTHAHNVREAYRLGLRKKKKTAKKHSKYVGVYWHKPTNKWYAQIRVNLSTKHLGLFKTQEEAHKVRDLFILNI